MYAVTHSTESYNYRSLPEQQSNNGHVNSNGDAKRGHVEERSAGRRTYIHTRSVRSDLKSMHLVGDGEFLNGQSVEHVKVR